jgi:hypothetical protein
MSALTVTTPLLEHTDSVNGQQNTFEVTRWLFGKRDRTVFSNGDITYTKSYNVCCCRPFTTKVIRGNRLESAELTSAGVSDRHLFFLWLFFGLCGAHRLAAGHTYSGLALLSTFISTVALTVISWVFDSKCPNKAITTCKVVHLVAIAVSLFLVATIVRWMVDFCFLRAWTRTTVKLITNNANETEVVINEHDNQAFDFAIREAMVLPDEGVV